MFARKKRNNSVCGCKDKDSFSKIPTKSITFLWCHYDFTVSLRRLNVSIHIKCHYLVNYSVAKTTLLKQRLAAWKIS